MHSGISLGDFVSVEADVVETVSHQKDLAGCRSLSAIQKVSMFVSMLGAGYVTQSQTRLMCVVCLLRAQSFGLDTWLKTCLIFPSTDSECSSEPSSSVSQQSLVEASERSGPGDTAGAQRSSLVGDSPRTYTSAHGGLPAKTHNALFLSGRNRTNPLIWSTALSLRS